jgi:LacI family transcriptional regulator
MTPGFAVVLSLQPMPVTMLDIARDLKVSVVTASKFCETRAKSATAPRKRVLRRAKELHHRMNWGGSRHPTYLHHRLAPGIHPLLFAEIARAVAQTVRPHGHHVIISYFEEDPELEESEGEAWSARQVDGLVIASGQPALA